MLLTFLGAFLQFGHFQSHLAVEVAESFLDAVVEICLFSGNLIESDKCLHDINRHVQAPAHSRPPGEGPVTVLQGKEFLYEVFAAVGKRVVVEVVGQQLLAVGFILGIRHPRCLIEQQRLELAVLGEAARKRGLVAFLLLPQGDRLGDVG